MAGGSSKKKHKRSNFTDKSSSSFSSLPSMASPLPSFSRRRNVILLIPLVLSLIGFVYIMSKTGFVVPTSRVYSIEVVNKFPHDPQAFTQGLLYGGNDTLFESTGLYGQSSLRKVAVQTGKVEALHKMEDSDFGEGLTLLGDRLIQVTWLTKTGFVYDRYNLNKLEKFTHQMRDGWGLATDGNVIFGTDGSSTLYELDNQDYKVRGKLTVTYEGHEVHNLNELEYVNGEVWANVWMTDCIARISPKDGIVRGWILLPQLRKQLLRSGYQDLDVLNGIAWDSDKNRLFVTGKKWPKLYEIKVHPIRGHFEGDIKQLCVPRHAFNFGKS